MHLLVGQKERVASFVCQLVPDFRVAGGYEGIGVAIDPDQIIAGVLYTNFRGNDVEMHVASAARYWLKPEFLWAFFAYPFEQLHVSRVTAIIAKDNKSARRFCQHLGFTEEGNAREAMESGADAIIYGLLRRECRFLGENDGQEFTNAA